MSNQTSLSTPTTAGPKPQSALTSRILWRVWKKCTKEEETVRFLTDLISLGVGLPSDEEFILSEEGRRRASKLGKKGKLELLETLTKHKLDDAKKDVKKTTKKKNKLRRRLESEVSKRKYINYQGKVKKHCLGVRASVRFNHQERAKWLQAKYRREEDWPRLGPDLVRYEECDILGKDCTMEAHDIEGAVIVNMTGEEIKLSKSEHQILKRGPKYCILKSCSEEAICCSVECCITKHKWDDLANDPDEPPPLGVPTEEELAEKARIDNLAEEMAAESRSIYDEENKSVNLNKLRVTDYKQNSRVILPRAQSNEKEAKLEVLRREIQESHKVWMEQHCNCKGDQVMNLDNEEQEGLKSLRKRNSEGEIVILPTDKSGRFAVMSFTTYVKAGMTHVNGDEEISLDGLKKNQKKINGHISMIIKIFGLGKNWSQENRMRESMLSEALKVCPLWLLFKCHKGWSKESGKVPPTRPVAGGNQGMNFPLSEVISWLLEPLASSMEGSSEVISGEDLRSIIDQLNIDNRKWEPKPDIKGSLDDHKDMVESINPPRLCACKEGECELGEVPAEGDKPLPEGWKKCTEPQTLQKNENMGGCVPASENLMLDTPPHPIPGHTAENIQQG